MAILYGTQSNGETLPVLVDQFGNLLAKGIDGQPGTPGEPGAPGEPGEPGAPGAPGGAFPLPPDPYEGAILGWLNNELAWIGSPPVPIPEGVFGPITNWDPAGLLTVEGDIPREVAKGVHIYQCNEYGTIYVYGWNNSQVWSSGSVNPQAVGLFNGNLSDGAHAQGADFVWTNPSTFTIASSLEFYSYILSADPSPNDKMSVVLDGVTEGIADLIPRGTTPSWWSVPNAAGKTLDQILIDQEAAPWSPYVRAVRVDGKLLVDAGDYPTAPNLNFRIQSVSGQNLLGVANRTDNFTIGKYLRVPEQNVARWLYDDNLIKVITGTGIDISRLTGN